MNPDFFNVRERDKRRVEQQLRDEGLQERARLLLDNTQGSMRERVQRVVRGKSSDPNGDPIAG